MNNDLHLQLWDQVLLRVLDIRLRRVEADEYPLPYILPASSFILCTHGSGELWLDDEIWLADGFYLLHSGKGRRLRINTEKGMELYFIFYKAVLPQNTLREFHILLQTDSPFDQIWGITPAGPLELLSLARQMLEGWHTGKSPIGRLQVKGVFMQFLHHVLQDKQSPGAVKPSVAEQAMRYLSQHYRSPVSIEHLSRQLNYTPQYVSRKFKELTGYSPLDYVIRLRLGRAQELLLATHASLQEIAAYVGYSDIVYFNRLFKKNTGVSPGMFRAQIQAGHNGVSDNAIKRLNTSLVMKVIQSYHINDNENHYQYIEDGEIDVHNHSKNLTTLLSLCIMLLLAACGTAQSGSQAAGGGLKVNEQRNNAAEPQTHEGLPEETRRVDTAFGEVEIPAQPQRVAAISYLGTVLALDVKPVAGEKLLMSSPYLEGMLGGVADVSESLEKLLELEPDLIITHNTDQEIYDKYKQIAPTVAMPYNSFESVQAEMEYFGKVLGKEEESRIWEEQFDKQVASARQQVQGAVSGKATLSVMQEFDGLVYLFGSKSGRGGRIMYELLGMSPPAAVPDELLQESFAEFSLELLPEYTGDYLLLTTESSLEELQADPIWGVLPAVKEGRVYLWSESRSWFRDPIAMLNQINDLADWLVAAAKAK
ncbi:AraC family transcriptional regulator [Paenibacillus tritici]|uniref:AraC family transcriptional regulator n=1 Tax=Paenibacillus tritici TaxID=1873425 RepID=UPI001BA5C5C1|nr:AraC family transcriptional regulator [Paenibacillus tritici]QUL57325.1 AraC family transcriptional regulator [Paenibacillus tritici]